MKALILLCLLSSPAWGAPIVQTLDFSRTTTVWLNDGAGNDLPIGVVTLAGTAIATTDYDAATFRFEWQDRSVHSADLFARTSLRMGEITVDIQTDPFGPPILEQQTVEIETGWQVLPRLDLSGSFVAEGSLLPRVGSPPVIVGPNGAAKWPKQVRNYSWYTFGLVDRRADTGAVLSGAGFSTSDGPGVGGAITIDVICDFSPTGCLMTGSVSEPTARDLGLGVPQLYEVPEPGVLALMASMLCLSMVRSHRAYGSCQSGRGLDPRP